MNIRSVINRAQLFAMSDVPSSRPLTRAASKQNYAAQPITSIREKFEKPRGHIKSKSEGHIVSAMDVSTHDLSDDEFADSAVLVPSKTAEMPGTVSHMLYTFSGFAVDDSDYYNYSLTCERFRDYLPEYPIEVIGTSMNHVGFVFPIDQREAILKAMKAQEGKFTSGGGFLSVTAINIAHAGRFTVPKPPPRPEMAVDIARFAALKSRINTPIVDTRRSSSAHSGLSPELIRKQEVLTNLLHREGPLMQPMDRLPQLPDFSSEVPGSLHTMITSLHSMQESLVSGMNEVRATLSHVVTRDDLRALHEAQHAEMQTYVQAETAPLHAGISQLSTDFKTVAASSVDHDGRIEQLESQLRIMRSQLSDAVSGGKFGKTNKHDPGLTKVAFLGFPSSLSREQCIREMRKFAESKISRDTNGELSYRIIDCDVFYKKGGDGKWLPTSNGYMQFGHRNARDAVMAAFGGREASLSVGGHNVKIRHGKTEADGLRDQVLYSAETAIKKHAAAMGKTVEKMMGKDRCVKVNGIVAFQQGSRQSGDTGAFMGPFSDLDM